MRTNKLADPNPKKKKNEAWDFGNGADLKVFLPRTLSAFQNPKQMRNKKMKTKKRNGEEKKNE